MQIRLALPTTCEGKNMTMSVFQLQSLKSVSVKLAALSLCAFNQVASA